MSTHLEGEVRFVGVVEKAGEEEAILRIFPEFCSALTGIENFSHIIVLYWSHLRDNLEHRSTLQVVPRRHKCASQVGVFACRSPTRPNPLGLCVVELMDVKDCVLRVKGLDAVSDSPLVDIKPYIPRSDCVCNARVPEWTSEGPKT